MTMVSQCSQLLDTFGSLNGRKKKQVGLETDKETQKRVMLDVV